MTVIPTIPERMATVESEVRHVRLDVGEIKQDVKATQADVSAIRDQLAQMRGGWRAILAAGAIGGAVVAAVAKFLPMMPR